VNITPTIAACAIVLFAIWVVCGLVIAGWFFADFQGRFPRIADQSRRDDLAHAILLGMIYGLLGPLGILLTWLLTGFAEYGWRLKV